MARLPSKPGCQYLVPNSRFPIFSPDPMRKCERKPLDENAPASERRCKDHVGKVQKW